MLRTRSPHPIHEVKMDTTAAMDILTNHTPKDVDEGTGPGYWGKCGTGALLWLQPTHLFAVEDGQPRGDDAGTGEDDTGVALARDGSGDGAEDEDGLNVSLEFSRDRLHWVIAGYGKPPTLVHAASSPGGQDRDTMGQIGRGYPPPSPLRRPSHPYRHTSAYSPCLRRSGGALLNAMPPLQLSSSSLQLRSPD